MDTDYKSETQKEESLSEETVRAAKQGKSKTTTAYEMYREAIYGYCCTLVSDKTDALEATDAAIRRLDYERKKPNDILDQLKRFASSICEDIDLVKQFKSGNRYAYDRLFKKYNKNIYSYCYFLLLKRNDPRADAEDATQEAFVRCFMKINKMKKDFMFYPYLKKTAKHICIDLYELPEVRVYDDEA